MDKVMVVEAELSDGTIVRVAVGQRRCMGHGGEHSPRLTPRGKPVRCFWCGVVMDAEAAEVRDGRRVA